MGYELMRSECVPAVKAFLLLFHNCILLFFPLTLLVCPQFSHTKLSLPLQNPLSVPFGVMYKKTKKEKLNSGFRTLNLLSRCMFVLFQQGQVLGC